MRVASKWCDLLNSWMAQRRKSDTWIWKKLWRILDRSTICQAGKWISKLWLLRLMINMAVKGKNHSCIRSCSWPRISGPDYDWQFSRSLSICWRCTCGLSNDRKSTSGWIFTFCGLPILWASKKQGLVTRSSMGSELVTGSFASVEGAWLINLLSQRFQTQFHPHPSVYWQPVIHLTHTERCQQHLYKTHSVRGQPCDLVFPSAPGSPFTPGSLSTPSSLSALCPLCPYSPFLTSTPSPTPSHFHSITFCSVTCCSQ